MTAARKRKRLNAHKLESQFVLMAAPHAPWAIHLPNDIWRVIFPLLSFVDIARLARVSKAMQLIARQSKQWIDLTLGKEFSPHDMLVMKIFDLFSYGLILTGKTSDNNTTKFSQQCTSFSLRYDCP